MDIYICRAGDSLPRLDRRFGLAEGSLARLNGLSDPQRLAPGLALLLPEDGPPPKAALELWSLPGPLSSSESLEALSAASSFISLPVASMDDKGQLSPVSDTATLTAAELGGALPFLTLANLSPQGSYLGTRAHRLLSKPESWMRMLTEAVQLCLDRGYRGLCLDIQYLPAFDKALCAGFYAEAARQLHQSGLLLAVCLADSEDARLQQSLSLAGQDIASAAAYADRLLLRPGLGEDIRLSSPSAESITKLLEHWKLRSLPLGKTLLCLPCQGSLYSLKRPESTPRQLSMSLGADIACSLGRPIHYESDRGTARLDYSTPDGDMLRLRFIDLRGLERRLDLVRSQGLAGLCLWGAESMSPAGLRLCQRRLRAEKLC